VARPLGLIRSTLGDATLTTIAVRVAMFGLRISSSPSNVADSISWRKRPNVCAGSVFSDVPPDIKSKLATRSLLIGLVNSRIGINRNTAAENPESDTFTVMSNVLWREPALST